MKVDSICDTNLFNIQVSQNNIFDIESLMNQLESLGI